MTGRKRSARKSATTTPKTAKAEKPQSTHLVGKDGEPHDNVTVFEPTHGPNMADRMDLLDDGTRRETLPAADPASEHAGIPFARRVDEGQNRGGE